MRLQDIAESDHLPDIHSVKAMLAKTGLDLLCNEQDSCYMAFYVPYWRLTRNAFLVESRVKVLCREAVTERLTCKFASQRGGSL